MYILYRHTKRDLIFNVGSNSNFIEPKRDFYLGLVLEPYVGLKRRVLQTYDSGVKKVALCDIWISYI